MDLHSREDERSLRKRDTRVEGRDGEGKFDRSFLRKREKERRRFWYLKELEMKLKPLSPLNEVRVILGERSKGKPRQNGHDFNVHANDRGLKCQVTI